MLEIPIKQKHLLLHYVANEKQGILYAKDFECVWFAPGEIMFYHANVLLANDMRSTEWWKSATRAVVLHQTLFYRPITS